jgi:hypothetical protein
VARHDGGLQMRRGGKARCPIGKFFTETFSIKTGLVGAVQAKKPPLSGQSTSISKGALKYIELKGLTD